MAPRGLSGFVSGCGRYDCGVFLKAKGVFSAISHVQEAVLILLLFVQLPHRDAETRDNSRYTTDQLF